MSKDIKNIIKYFDLILNENKSFVDEASASSTSLFGGTSVKIPAAGAHGGQSGWQSSNAWDIMAPVGTPVYALADGVAETFSDYGKDVVKTQGKKLYGQSFTVKSDNNLPDVYYTHLEGSPIRQGSKIKCGQFLGYIMDFPDSSSDHVHIGVSSGHKIEEFLNSDGTLKCGGGGIIGQAPESSSTGKTKGNLDFVTNPDQNFVNTIVKPIAKMVGLSESNRGKETFYLRFCNVSPDPNIKNGKKVNSGELLGKTNTDDIVVFKLDSNKSRVKLRKGDLNLGKNTKEYLDTVIIPKDSNDKIKSPISGIINNSSYIASCKNQITIEYTVGSDEKTVKGDSKKPTFSDPLIGAIVTAPFNIFKDKYDEKGDLKQKRWGYPGEKVDPWIVDTLSAPFKKMGKIFKEEEVRKTKKLNENINKIKRLIK